MIDISEGGENSGEESEKQEDDEKQEGMECGPGKKCTNVMHIDKTKTLVPSQLNTSEKTALLRPLYTSARNIANDKGLLIIRDDCRSHHHLPGMLQARDFLGIVVSIDSVPGSSS
ncbi:unnamed protein product [Toxocara canis]|uniref:Uncharacterized protein n=1 Tax=Toxocara canis TaxID=6265 RepID=A0A183U4B0_TOXCA|nr:unnamed protein product [Toxocara canis]